MDIQWNYFSVSPKNSIVWRIIPYMEKYDGISIYREMEKWNIHIWRNMMTHGIQWKQISVFHIFFKSISEILSFSQTRKNRFSNYNQSHMLHVWNIYPCLSHLGKCWQIYHTCGMLGMGHIWRNHPEIVGFFSDDYI